MEKKISKLTQHPYITGKSIVSTISIYPLLLIEKKKLEN